MIREHLTEIRRRLSALERELGARPAAPKSGEAPMTDAGPRCIACRSAIASESRTVRLLGGDQVLEVCGTCAGLSARLVASLVEDGIHDGDVVVHHEF